MNESEIEVPEIVTIPKERAEYVAPKLEQHFDYRILITGGGSI
jgi:hypothetical protein